MKRIHASVPEKTKRVLQIAAIREGLTLSAYLTKLASQQPEYDQEQLAA